MRRIAGETAAIGVARVAHRDRRRQAVHDQVVPLVKHRDAQIACGNIRERERTVPVALGKVEVGAIRRAQARIALREAVGRIVAAAVDALIGCAAHVQVRDMTVDGHVARLTGGTHPAGSGGLAPLDDGRVGEAEGDVVAAWPEFLEVRRLAGLDEGFDRLGAVERARLQPLLAARDPVSARRGRDLVQSRIEVGNDRLPGQRGERLAIVFVFRADRNDPNDAVTFFVDRTGIVSGDGVRHVGQRVGHRHVEHVVRDLAGRVSQGATLVENDEVEPFQTGLVGRQDVHAATGVVLTVQGAVILIHHHGDLGRRQGGLLQDDVDCLRPRPCRDLRSAHDVAAHRIRIPCRPRAGVGVGAGWVRAAILGDVERPLRAVGIVRIHRYRARGAADRGIDTIAGHDGNVVALVRVETHFGRGDLRLLVARVADTVADVADRIHVVAADRIQERLSGFARNRSDTALCHDRHVRRVKIRPEGRNRARSVVDRRRIHIERPVFLDDPAIVADLGLSLRVAHMNRESTLRREAHRHGRCGGARRILRVFRLVGERVGPGCRRRRGERSVRRHAHGQICSVSACLRDGRRVNGERQPGRVGIVGEHSGRADLQSGRDRACIAIGIGGGPASEAATRMVAGIALSDRRGRRGGAVYEVGEGSTAPAGGCVIRECAVRLEGQ